MHGDSDSFLSVLELGLLLLVTVGSKISNSYMYIESILRPLRGNYRRLSSISCGVLRLEISLSSVVVCHYVELELTFLFCEKVRKLLYAFGDDR